MNLDDIGIIVAGLCGATIGIERQWSGHATGRSARFAGLRTFTLLGLVAGLSGWLWSRGFESLAAVVLAGAAALVVAGYVAASRHGSAGDGHAADAPDRVDGTTEAAAMVVLGAGAMAGAGQLALASALVSLTALLLVEKTRLHDWVARIDDAGLRASFRFAVMALVILPLLPAGPYGPLGGVRPRELWLLVLFFSGLSFAGYLARRTVGPRHGSTVTGLLGGLVSSTSVVFSFARASRKREVDATQLAHGAIAACTVMFVRVFAAGSVLNRDLTGPLLALLGPPFLVGAAITARALVRPAAAADTRESIGNPLQLRSALQMALLFQVVLWLVVLIRERAGVAGLFATAAVVGLTDTDALTLSMSKSASAGLPVLTAARGVAVGILSNTLFKLALVAGLGEGRFRRVAGWGMAALAAGSVAALIVVR
jgi:uncharacterized membrane protein (DUF4010 family)